MKLKVNRAALAALFAAAGIMSAHAQIFEANYGVGTIGEYDATTGALIGTPITGLDNPTGLALAGSNLVVANYNGPTGGNSGSVAEYTTSGQAVGGFSPITGLPQPISVSVSGSDLFVATNGAGNGGAIGEYDARTGAALNASLISGLNTPVSVLASGSNLYVLTGGSSGSLLRYSLSGSHVGPRRHWLAVCPSLRRSRFRAATSLWRTPPIRERSPSTQPAALWSTLPSLLDSTLPSPLQVDWPSQGTTFT